MSITSYIPQLPGRKNPSPKSGDFALFFALSRSPTALCHRARSGMHFIPIHIEGVFREEKLSAGGTANRSRKPRTATAFHKENAETQRPKAIFIVRGAYNPFFIVSLFKKEACGCGLCVSAFSLLKKWLMRLRFFPRFWRSRLVAGFEAYPLLRGLRDAAQRHFFEFSKNHRDGVAVFVHFRG